MKNKSKKNKHVNKILKRELNHLLQLPHIDTFSEDLRRMFIDYLHYEIKIGVPVYFDEFLYPLNCLFDFLDAVAKEKLKIEKLLEIKRKYE